MYSKALILRNFVSFIIILDIFTCYFIFLDDNSSIEIERRRKRLKMSKERESGEHAQAQSTACHGMCRNQKLVVASMPQHAMEHAMACMDAEIGSVQNAAACYAVCRNMRGKNRDNVAALRKACRDMRAIVQSQNRVC